MNANEMAQALEIYSDRIGSRASDGYEDVEISEFLNRAMEYYIVTILERISPTHRGLEESELRSWGLANLIKTGSGVPNATASDNITNGKFCDLANDVWFLIYETAFISALDCDDRPIEADVRPISHSQIKPFKRNFYKKPKVILNEDARVWRIAFSRLGTGYVSVLAPTNKRVELLEDPRIFTVTKYRYRYIKTPLPIVSTLMNTNNLLDSNQKNCELDEMTHRIIVDIAQAIVKGTTDRKEIANLIPFHMIR
jgi:hypothetical protein